MNRFIAIIFYLAFGVSYANAQTPVTTQPYGVRTLNASSTITITNTFQSVFAANSTTFPNTATGRSSCTIQNNGANTMWVYFGPIASATKGASFALSAGTSSVAGQSVNCSVGGVVLQDQVSITGTSGDAFYAAQQ